MCRFCSIVFLVIITLPCNAQFSLDSLLSVIRNSYSETGRKEYLLETFTQFESADKKDRYDFFLDSTGNIQEYIGLSFVHYGFDDHHRILLIEGFNRIGERSYWDFPVVTKFRYVSDTLVPEMNTIRKEICRCETPNLKSDVVITQELNSAEDAAYDKIRVAVTSEDSTGKLSFTVCSDGEICNRKSKQAAYIFRKFDTKNKGVIVGEWHFNRRLKLVDGHYAVFTGENVSISSSTKEYAYSIRELKDGKIDTIRYYNRKRKLVETSYHSSGPIINGPVNVPVRRKRK